MNYEKIANDIFIKDELDKADVILIPGSSELCLAETASNLYNKGFSEMIVISGGKNKKLPENDTEASYLKRYMVKQGIPENDIVVDVFATNTQENAEISKKLCGELKMIQSAIIVCKNYHAGRVKKTYQKYFIENCKLMICPVTDSRNVSKENWYKDSYARKIVLSEYQKNIKYFNPHE